MKTTIKLPLELIIRGKDLGIEDFEKFDIIDFSEYEKSIKIEFEEGIVQKDLNNDLYKEIYFSDLKNKRLIDVCKYANEFNTGNRTTGTNIYIHKLNDKFIHDKENKCVKVLLSIDDCLDEIIEDETKYNTEQVDKLKDEINKLKEENTAFANAYSNNDDSLCMNCECYQDDNCINDFSPKEYLKCYSHSIKININIIEKNRQEILNRMKWIEIFSKYLGQEFENQNEISNFQNSFSINTINNVNTGEILAKLDVKRLKPILFNGKHKEGTQGYNTPRLNTFDSTAIRLYSFLNEYKAQYNLTKKHYEIPLTIDCLYVCEANTFISITINQHALKEHMIDIIKKDYNENHEGLLKYNIKEIIFTIKENEDEYRNKLKEVSKR